MNKVVNSKKLCLYFVSLLFLFVGFFPPTAAFSSEESCHNGIKILSDFDDTIKTYPSKKMAIMGFNALFKKHINVGFDHLYKGIIGQKSGSFCGEEAPLTVISASPSFLYPMVDKLLTSYQFPSHKIILRPIGKKSRQFKMEVFGKILEREEGPFLLIGDDVNEDPVIYHELKNKFPEKIEEVYIHNVENKEGFEGQKSYWTAFDLGLMEFEKGRISLKTLLKIGEKLLQSSPWKVIPPYGHCPSQGFMKRSVIEDEAILKLAEKIDLRVQEICKAR